MADETDEYYRQMYSEKISNLSGAIKDFDEKNVIYDEMSKLRYTPTDNPELDAELNFTKARLKATTAKKFDTGTESYLRFRARETGKSLSEARAWARRALKNSNDDE
jgi:hypothetical protein